MLLAKLVLGIVLLFEGFCFVREVGLVAAVVFAVKFDPDVVEFVVVTEVDCDLLVSVVDVFWDA